MGSARLDSKHNLFQSGQGILEVIVTIGIGTIMILALVVLSVRANKSSDFSKASSQASLLAAQGIEIINNIKTANQADPSSPNPDFRQILQYGSCDGVIIPDTFYSWDDFYKNINVDDENTSLTCSENTGNKTISSLYGRAAVLHIPGPSCNPLWGPIPTWELHITSADGNTYLTGNCETLVKVDNIEFHRFIFVADTPLSSGGESNCNSTAGDWNVVKQFTVVVSWTDSTGTHQQTDTSCIGR